MKVGSQTFVAMAYPELSFYRKEYIIRNLELNKRSTKVFIKQKLLCSFCAFCGNFFLFGDKKIIPFLPMYLVYVLNALLVPL